MKSHWNGAAVLALLVLGAPLAQAQTGIARGKVLDEKGEPVRGASVVFDYRGGFEQKYETKTNEKGEYTQIVSAGRYRVTASKQDYQGAYLDVTINGGAPTQVPEMRLTSREAAIKAAVESDAVLGPLQKGIELTRAGKLDEAITAYQKALAADPKSVEARFNLGAVYLRKQDWAAAEDAFRKVIEQKPDLGEAYGALAQVYKKTERPEKAIEVLSQGVAARPKDAQLQFSLAALYLNAKRAKEAEAAFRRVEVLDPGNAQAQYVLATLALNAGRTDEAVERLRKYLAIAPADAAERTTAQALLSQLEKPAQP